MSNFKRFLSAVMAFVMAFGMLTCLGSVVANADINPPQVEELSFRNKNGVTDVFYRAYRNGSSDWQAVTPQTFNSYNRTYQNYNSTTHPFGIKSYSDLCTEYQNEPFIYYGIEVYESDGELTDHYVEPGDELTLRAYCKSNVYITGFNAVIMGSRRFFDFNGPTYTNKGYWVSNLDKQGDGLNNTGYTAMAMKAPDAINSLNPMITDDVTGGDDPETTIEISPKTISQHSGMTVNKTGLDAALLNSLDYYLATVSIGNIGRFEGLYSQTNEWLFDWIITVRTEAEPYHKAKANATNYSTVNPFDTDSDGVNDYLIGDLGIDINSCSNVTNGQRAQAFNCVLDDLTDAADEDNSYNLGVVVDMTGCDHVFMLGEAPAAQTYTATFMDGANTITALTQDEIDDGDTITLPNYTKQGYVLVGWTADNGATVLQPGATYTVTDDVTFTAVWGHTVTYVDGQTVLGTQVYAEGAAITPIADPTKQGATFAGWSGLPQTMGNADVTVTATWSYILTIVYDNGQPNTTTSYVEGAAITPPADPTKEGYTFNGWNPPIPPVMPGNDLTVTAQWAEIVADKYTITYTVDGSTYTTQQYEEGETIVPPANPSKTGYTFNGWTGIPSTMPAQDISVAADFTVNTHTVTYQIDGENYEVIPNVAYGSSIPAPAQAPSRTGHTFSGWQNVPATMPDNDVVITGTFTANSYTMTFLSNIGTTISSGSQTYGDVLVCPPAPAVEGKTFAYWEAADGTVVNLADIGTATVPAANTVWTARYVGNSHTVTYTIDGVYYAQQTVAAGARIYPPTDVPAREGYTFSGWSVDSVMPDNDVTYDATYNINTYRITYVLANGQANIVQSYAYGAAVTAPANPSKTGSTFAGWDTTIPATMPASDLTITALWNAVTYHVTYVLDNGEPNIVQDYSYGDTIVPPANPSKQGNSFSGWSPALPGTMPAEDLTVTAQWTEGAYTVTYYVRDTDQGTYTVYGSDSYAFGAQINARPVKTATGWTYSPWLTSAGQSLPATMPAESIDVYSTGTKNLYHDIWYGKDGEIIAERDVYYDEQIPTIALPTYEGYTGAYWFPTDTVQKAENMVFNYRSAAGSANYTIKTILEKYDGTVDEIIETFSGTTDDPVALSPSQMQRTGYDFDADHSVTSSTINGNGTTQLVARFNLHEYNFIYTDNSGTHPSTVKYTTPLTVPTAAAKEGHTFAGWTWTRDNGTTLPNNTLPATMPAYNINGNASYTINSYNLIYKVDGEVYKTVTYQYGANITPEPAPERDGFTFSGWDNVPATMPAADTIVNGSFSVEAYAVIFMVDGVEYYRISADYGDDISGRMPAAPTKEGYTFTAWNPSVPATMPAGNLTVNATFTVNYYTAYFRDGDRVIATRRTAYGAQIDVPASPTKVGYTFAKWSDGTNEYTPAEVAALTMGAADITFNATWTANSYDAVFYAVDGDAEPYATVTGVTFGDSFAPPATDPTRPAYEFVGWKLAGTSAVTTTFVMDGEGRTYVGVWEQDTSASYIYSAGLASPSTYYAKGYALYNITLKDNIFAEDIYVNDGTKTIAFSKASYVKLGADSGVENIEIVGGKEVWTVGLVLAEASDTYRVYCTTTDGLSDQDNALIFDVAYAQKPGSAVEDEFISYAISDTTTYRGQYLTWTFVTSEDVTWIKLDGVYTPAEGAQKKLTTIYKYDTTSSNVTRTVSNGTATWSVRMRFTYSTDDLSILEAWTISYKVGSGTTYFKVNAGSPVNVTVGKDADALAQSASALPKYSLVNASVQSANVTAGVYTPVTIVTTDDCTKVRIGTGGKFATYQTTSANTSYTDEGGLRTWTINYKFKGSGSTEYTVNARGSVWGDPVTFNVVIG